MRPLLALTTIAIGGFLFLGCAEESLDVPLGGVLDAGDIQYAPALPREKLVKDPSPTPAFNAQPARDLGDGDGKGSSAVDSVWNAMLRGTAQALDEGTP